jgi:hypothetical protein
MPGAAENVAQRVGPGGDRRSPGTAATGPGRTAPPLLPFSCSAKHENHVPCGAGEIAPRRACSTRYCAASIRVSMGTIPCGVPREWPPGDVRDSHQAGRRAGAEARRAPNVTAGRCIGEPSDPQRLGPCPTPCPVTGSGYRDRIGPRRCRCRCPCRCRWFSATRVAEPGAAEGGSRDRRPHGDQRPPGTEPWTSAAARHRCASCRAEQSTRFQDSAEHMKSRHGGRAVHGIVPPAFEFRWAQYRVGSPPGVASRRRA